MDGDGLAATTTLFCTMKIIRNDHAPNITNLPFTRPVDQTVSQQSIIYTVEAEDKDSPVRNQSNHQSLLFRPNKIIKGVLINRYENFCYFFF